jgi:hypothetical protein
MTNSEDPIGGPADAVDKEILIIVSRSALMTGLCFLIPIPFLDDWMATRVQQRMVRSLLLHHKRSYKTVRLRVIYEGESVGCVSGCLGLLWALIVKPLKKLFKTIFFVLAMRDVALAIGSTLFLGRCLHRSLASGKFDETNAAHPASHKQSLESQALKLYLSFKTSFEKSDQKILVKSLRPLLVQAKGLGTWGVQAVKKLFGKKREYYEDVETLSEDQQAEVNHAVEDIRNVMEQDDIRTILTDFDAAFDKEFAARIKE